MIGARLLHHRKRLPLIIPMMTHQLGVTTRAIETHLGQKPNLGGGTPTSHSSIYHVSSVLCISMFHFLFGFCFCFPKTQKDQKYFCCFSWFVSSLFSFDLPLKIQKDFALFVFCF